MSVSNFTHHAKGKYILYNRLAVAVIFRYYKGIIFFYKSLNKTALFLQ
nr:MAG TPA: hypothetical protein [Caudoviricetes sp.]